MCTWSAAEPTYANIDCFWKHSAFCSFSRSFLLLHTLSTFLPLSLFLFLFSPSFSLSRSPPFRSFFLFLPPHRRVTIESRHNINKNLNFPPDFSIRSSDWDFERSLLRLVAAPGKTFVGFIYWLSLLNRNLPRFRLLVSDCCPLNQN